MNYLLDKEKELLKLNAELDERNKKLSGGESPQKKPGKVKVSGVVPVPNIYPGSSPRPDTRGQVARRQPAHQQVSQHRQEQPQQGEGAGRRYHRSVLINMVHGVEIFYSM